MEKRKLIGAAEVADRLGVSRSTAYTVIRTINHDMAEKGKRTIPGKVDEAVFDATYFAVGKELDDVRPPRG